MGDIWRDRTWTVISTGEQYIAPSHTAVALGIAEAAQTNSKSSNASVGFVKGEFSINPYTVSRTAWVGGAGTISNTIKQSDIETIATYYGPIGAYCIPSGVLTSNKYTYSALEAKRNLTLQKAFSKVGEADFEGGVELGELRETLQFLSSPLKALRSYLMGGNPKKVDLLAELSKLRGVQNALLSSGKKAADVWLSIRYGLRPLVNSVCDAMQLVEKGFSTFDKGKIRSTLSTWEESDPHVYESDVGWIDMLLVRKRTINTSARIRAKVYYKSTLPRSLAGNLGLTPNYLPEIAWELTRLSFVLDWVLSVGPWLGSFRVNPGISILGNTVSTKILVDSRGVLTPKIMYPGIQTVDGTVSDTTYFSEYYQRVINTAMPTTPLLRGLDSADLFHAIDSLSLIMQPVSNRLRKKMR